jgi:glycosyltransferase involved in cell wall biosynthesis
MTVAILDDLFPWKGSGFRFAEYDYYLKNLSDVKVYSTLNSLGFVGQLENKQRILSEVSYGEKFRAVSNFEELPEMSAYYCVFLHNVPSIIQLAERDNAPFAFTLYPGGGFELFNENVYQKLESIFKHPLFHAVVVTQPETLKVVQNLECPPEKIKYVFGVVSDCKKINRLSLTKLYSRKRIKHIVWAAHKYDDLGLDKGLDLFVRMADELVSEQSKIKFHVIGPWREAIATLSCYPDSFIVHEILPIEKLGSFFAKMDVAVFPTRRNINSYGRFDGFPTATMVQAAMAGAITISTNPLGQSTPLVSNVHYLEIEESLESLNSAIHKILEVPSYARNLAHSSRDQFYKIFGTQAQLAPRLEVLRSLQIHSNQS